MIDKNRKTTTLPKDTSEKNTSTESKDPIISLGKKFNSFKQLKNLVNAQQTEPSNQGTKTISVSQPPLKIHRLLETAKEFNIGKERLINFLNDNGFEITNDPGKKLSEAMYKAVSAEFTKDKDAKRRSKLIKLSKTEVEATFRKLNNAGKLDAKTTPPLLSEPFKKEKTQRKKEPKMDHEKLNSESLKISNIENGNINKKIEPKTTVIEGASIPAVQVPSIPATPKNKSNKKQKKIRFVFLIPEKEVGRIANGIAEIEWENVDFLKDGIRVKYRKQWSNKFPVKNAHPSFNVIKAYYHFKGLPKLKTEISNNTVQKILNEEVLFYCIIFLENSGAQLPHDLIQSNTFFDKHKRYTKAYYKEHLPELFLPKCFNFLCERSASNLPIIPVLEKIINSGGVMKVDDSFLFPLIKNHAIYWCWESREESKATYLFRTTLTHFDSQLQRVFDYLTGDTVNKRETIIRSFELQKHLGLVERIYHNDFPEWKRKVRGYSDYSI